MVSNASVNKQLKRIGFQRHGWGRGELSELAHILLPDEEIHECVNGIYEGGFALLVATDVRVLLIDKKPLNFLTVEDLRFDMINEMDYSHRLLGAQINIATGSRNLQFRSYNQVRLRKLIGHVQHSMADGKKKQTGHQEDQSLHLEKINQQLQAYLVAQHQQQLQLQQLQSGQQSNAAQAQQQAPVLEPVKPSPELSDYLFAQSLLAQHQADTGDATNMPQSQPPVVAAAPVAVQAEPQSQDVQLSEIYAEGMREIFGDRQPAPQPAAAPVATVQQPPVLHPPIQQQRRYGAMPKKAFEVNPLRIAYSKLPMVLRNRKFGRPSLHEHSQYDPDSNVGTPLDFDSAAAATPIE